MIEYLTTLTTNVLLWLTLGVVGLAVSIIGWMIANKSGVFWGEYESVFKETATGNLEDMFLFIDPQQLFLANIAALIVTPILAFMLTGDLFISGAIALMVLCLPVMIYRNMKARRLRMFETQLPEALVMISGSLAAGASLNMALQSVVKEQPAPLSQEFMLFTREQRIGVDFDTSLKNMERRLPLQDFLMFTSAMRISREVGGDLGDVLDTLSATLRKKAAMEGKIQALTAQGKMQGFVMTGLPVFLGLLLFLLEPVAMAKLFTTVYGWILLSLIVVMEVLGYIFIKKVTTIDV